MRRQNKPYRDSNFLSEKTIQRVAFILLFFLILTDKLLNLMTPTLPDYWYGVTFAVGIKGSKVIQIIQRWR